MWTDELSNETIAQSKTDVCGIGGNPEKCGELCFGGPNTLPESTDAFYCEKGEKCCPTPPQDEQCVTLCQTYDTYSNTFQLFKIYNPHICHI